MCQANLCASLPTRSLFNKTNKQTNNLLGTVEFPRVDAVRGFTVAGHPTKRKKERSSPTVRVAMKNGDRRMQSHISSPPGRTRTLEGRMEPDDQPESDNAASWRAGMSPSSSLRLALHVRGGVTEVAMQSTGQCQWGSVGAAPLPGAQGSAVVG